MEKRNNMNDLSFNKSENGGTSDGGGAYDKMSHKIMFGDSKQPFTKMFSDLDNNMFYNSKQPHP